MCILFFYIQNAYADKNSIYEKMQKKICLMGQIVIESYRFLEYWQNRWIHVSSSSFDFIWAGNFKMVDIKIKAWSSFFLNLETNLIVSWKVNKIQPIRVVYQKPGNLKFCAPFKIIYKNGRDSLNKKKRFLIFLY